MINRPTIPGSFQSPFICRQCISLISSRINRRYISSRRRPDKQKLPNFPARTRFAPSPTGFLHLGSLRTALYNYLLAKRTGGQFILRIEDTDKKRTVPGATKRLYDDLRWAGLQWDEGPEVDGPFGPYKQSERTDFYSEHARKLLDNGHGYRCFCTPERLRELADHRSALGIATDYDRKCAHIPEEEADERAENGEPFVIRLLAPDLYPEWSDLVYGQIGKQSLRSRTGESAWQDPILLKSDGQPTYHLANVVDDHLMNITHVIRGTEWISSTHKHQALYNAFGWEPPVYAHVGLLVDGNQQKLSKRDRATDLAFYKSNGYFPETVVNFLALLGWSHQEKSDFFPLKELVEKFSPKFTKGNATVSFGKLEYLQTKYATKRINESGAGFDEIVEQAVEAARQRYQRFADSHPDFHDYIVKVIKADVNSFKTVPEFIHRNAHFFEPLPYETSKKPLSDASLAPQTIGGEIHAELDKIANDVWTHENINDAVQKTVQQLLDKVQPKHSAKLKGKVSERIHRYLRVALADGSYGPPNITTATLLGKQVVLKRLNGAAIEDKCKDVEDWWKEALSEDAGSLDSIRHIDLAPKPL
ncbi:glutamyl-tRNA synthetase [Patellaria atrata CBS 101060]|uniref:Glutamate--tRNA ligase, mitochondrial n=1 Tax=Patellaria atrata CBS 101060 TaxID=1346257 RepID=A0A9P4S3K8_9PEZI|nr:glutamyl-tRNA synthetase [Patellaria atrata CBS 101060]